MTAYIALIDRLTSFQTWQALIHFGAKARQKSDLGQLRSLFTLGWLLDVASGALGYALAVTGVWVVPHLFGLTEVGWSLVSIAALPLLVNWVSTATGITRLYDRFISQALYQKFTAGAHLVGVSLLWLNGVEDLSLYIVVWTVGTGLGYIFFSVMALIEVRRQGIFGPQEVDLRRLTAEYPELWRFVLTTNVDGVVRVFRDLDIFLVNGVLGPGAAGLYKIAQVVARGLGKLTGPFYQAIYPDLAQMLTAREDDHCMELMRQSGLTLGGIATACWLGFLVFGGMALHTVFGAEFVPAYEVAAWCLAGMTVWAFAQPLLPGMMALGRVGTALSIHLLTTMVYITVLWFGLKVWGLPGAGIALFLFHSIWTSLMAASFLRFMRERSLMEDVEASGRAAPGAVEVRR